MIAPGKNYVGGVVRIGLEVEDSNQIDFDPSISIVLKVLPPRRTTTGMQTYTYGTDIAMQKDAIGYYYVDFSPNCSGQWSYRWETVGTNANGALEGTFLVQVSPFSNPPDVYDYCGWSC